MATRVLVLGAGFGGLELSSALSEALGDTVEVTLIDHADSFVFGYSKLDVMFGRAGPDEVRLPYSAVAKPGVRLVREKITAIDPEARGVRTDAGDHDADVMVVALGADYDFDATPGLVEAENEFYTLAGAEHLRDVLPDFTAGRALVGVCDTPFKCPPAPSEAALLLHDYLTKRGVRDDCEIAFTIPLPSPVPPSPDTSRALLDAFDERGIEFTGGVRVSSLDAERGVAAYDNGSQRPYDLFLGVPRHRAPDVVVESGMTDGGYIPVDSATLRTRHEGVYALGDVATVGVPKAGVFAEGAAKVVAADLVAQIRDAEPPAAYDGLGSCYVEFGAGRVGKVDVDFLSGPKPTGSFHEPSPVLVAEKQRFGATRRARWFGL